ncbi:MAG: GLUG motif-containing protein [Dehalococcoidia bacterium]
MVILDSKRRHYAARVSIFLITVALIAGMAGCDGDGHTLPPSQNLEIRDWYDLYAVRDNLGGNHTLMNDLDSTIAGYEELASPTANQGKGWQPIGFFGAIGGGCGGVAGGVAPWWYGLTGTFDGQGHEIRDLFINRPDEGDVGLFGVVDGVIKDTGVVNITVIGDEGVGGLVGSSTGTVSNSYSSGNVIGNSSVGGLVGWNEGTVSNSHFTGTVTSEGSYVGGLVGLNWYGTVTDSYSTSSVTGKDGVGGLVGQNDGAKGTGEGTVSNSYSSGSVTGEDGVGGLVGENQGEGTVSNSYYDYDDVLINGANIITIGALFGEDFDQWLANDKFLDVNERLSQENDYYVVNNVTDFKQLLAFGQDDSLKFRLTNDLDLGDEPNFYIPYLAGEFDGNGHKISNLTFDFDFVPQVGLFGYLAPGGKVTQVGVENANITGADIVGSLVGESWGTVSNSYSTGNVIGDEYVGGLVGSMGDRVTVSNSYSTGSVNGNSSVGGLVGANEGEATVSNSFWDIQTSGQSTSDDGTGKTTAQMKSIATFSGAGWKITAVANPGTRNHSYIWNIVNGVTYPFLSWQSVS